MSNDYCLKQSVNATGKTITLYSLMDKTALQAPDTRRG